MELIVAVYDDWGIGKDGTQPVALSVDRKFFRETTRGAMVIVGRRTIEDFPGQKPLPGRVNVALTRTPKEIPGFTVVTSPDGAAALAATAERAMVIGGGSIYRQMLPMCDTAYVTKVHTTVESDTFSPIWMKMPIGAWRKCFNPVKKMAFPTRCVCISGNNNYPPVAVRQQGVLYFASQPVAQEIALFQPFSRMLRSSSLIWGLNNRSGLQFF